MQTITLPGPITPEQYLEDEFHRKERHEYLGGYVYAMAGGTAHHNIISVNVCIALTQHYRRQGCRVFQEGMKAKVAWGGHTYFYYPDVMVCCDPSDHVDEYFCTKPCILVEVLSDSTARYDRGEKFLAYQQLPSLQNYLVVSQQAMHVTLHRRSNNWLPELFTNASDLVLLNCGGGHPDFSMSLTQIYDTVL